MSNQLSNIVAAKYRINNPSVNLPHTQNHNYILIENIINRINNNNFSDIILANNNININKIENELFNLVSSIAKFIETLDLKITEN